MFDAISKTAKINDGEPNPVPQKQKIGSTEQLDPKKPNGRIELKPVDRQVNDAMLDDFSKVIEMIHHVRLDHSIHKESGTIIVRIIDKDTDKVIREIPNEEMLDLVSRFYKLRGLLFNGSA